MEFLLTLKRRGIGDQAVLRAMDAVAARAFRRGRFCRQRLCRPGAADFLRANHQPALCRRLYDRATGVAAASSRARSRHRLGLSGRRACRGWRARWCRIERYRTLADQARSRLLALGYDNVEVIAGDGFAGVPDARAVRPHHRHRGRRRGAAGRWSINWPTMASWSCRLGRKTDRNTLSSLPNRKRTGI